MSATPRLSRSERQAQTREGLLRAAAEVFAVRGFERATIQEIADAAGVTTGAIYSNFTGKGDLFLALFEQQIEGRVDELAGSPATAADRWMGVLRDEPRVYPFFLEFLAHARRRPELQPRLAEVFGSYRRAVAGMVEAGAARRDVVLPDGAADQLAAAIVALANGIAVERLADPDAVSDDLYDWALRLLLDGFERTTGTDAKDA